MVSDAQLNTGTVYDQRIVFVVDDDAGSRESLVSLMQSVGLNCTAYASPLDFLDDFGTESSATCAVVVLDVRLPYLGGLDVLRRIQEMDPDIPIVMITGFGDVSSAVSAIKHGAVDYIEKPVNPQILLDTVQKSLNAREETLRDRLALVDAFKRYRKLSPRELEVAEFICEGLSNKQIADRLNLSDRTVEKYRISAIAKMEVDSTIRFVKMFEKAKTFNPARYSTQASG